MNNLPRVLVVGSRSALADVIRQLEATGRYELDFAPSPHATPLLLEALPHAVLIDLPGEGEAREEVFTWLETLQTRVPTVVLCRTANPKAYVAYSPDGGPGYVACWGPLETLAQGIVDATGVAAPRLAA